MRKPLLLLLSVGLISCLQVLGLDKYTEGAPGGGTTASSNASSSTTATSGSASMSASSSSSASGTGGGPPSYKAQAVTAGDKHTCALLTDGRVVCWGDNTHGQLGDGTFTASPIPVLVKGLATATAISAGTSHTCALLTTGDVRCWGHNSLNQLGIGMTADQAKPVAPIGLPSGIGGVSAGDSHTCAFVMGGKGYCWGFGGYGELGRNSTVTNDVEPVDTLTSVQSIASGGHHTCAADGMADIWCWGDNSHKQISGATMTSYPDPSRIIAAGTTGFVMYAHGVPVVTALDTSCNLGAGGGVACWGRNDMGQSAGTPGADVGAATSAMLTKVTDLSAGGQHVCARFQDGSVECWGANDVGQLGNGTDANFTGTPGPVMGITTATAIGVGLRHSCAIIDGGAAGPSVECWGANDAGQLGDGTLQEAKAPVHVKYLP